MAKQKPYSMISPDASKIRELLRKNIPQINELENRIDVGFKNLKVIEVYNQEKSVLILYEGIALPKLYPNVGKKLIEKRWIRKKNLLSSRIANKGQENEYEEVYLGLNSPDSYRVLVFLKAYNPNYEISLIQNFKN